MVLKDRMNHKIILLVEDNLDDELLTTRALKKNHILNEVVIMRDGAETLDYLFGTGAYADRDIRVMPQIIMLDLKLPKIDGLEVLKRLRSDERTKPLPVIVFISSKNEQDLIESYKLGPNSYMYKPINYAQFTAAIRQLELHLLVLNKANSSNTVQMETEKTADITSDDYKLPSTPILPIAENNRMFDTRALNPRLYELISNMSEEEIQGLIEELEDRTQAEFMEKRKYLRKQTFLFADCSSHNISFSDFIQNISAGGLFIETKIPLFIDQKLSITFTLPGDETPKKIKGKVARLDSKGVGVNFDEILHNI